MSADIGPGTPVICIKGCIKRNVRTGELRAITKNALYFVSEIVSYTGKAAEKSCSCCGKTAEQGCAEGLVLKHLPRTLWCKTRFRPLNDGDTRLVDTYAEDKTNNDLIATIKEPTKELV